MKSKIKTTLAGIIMIAATIQLGLMPPSSANAGDTLASAPEDQARKAPAQYHPKVQTQVSHASFPTPPR